MTTTSTTLSRSAAFLAAAVAITTTTALRAPASVADEPAAPERPCFLTPAHWNTALDGPVPTCPTPVWRLPQEKNWGAPGSSAGTAPRRTQPVGEGAADVATLADCLDPARWPVVRTCPYPIKSGDRFSDYLTGTRRDDSSGAGGL